MPDSAQSPTHKAAKLAVIILSCLIILALIALVVGGVMKFGGKGKTAVNSPAGAEFALPAGSTILRSETQPGRLILHVRTPQGEEIDILDTANGRLVARVKAADK